MSRLLILASSSPRRRRALAAAGYRFEVATPDVDERPLADEGPQEMVERLARRKADAVAVDLSPEVFTIGFDTVVVLDGRMIGKPVSPTDAVATLVTMAGRTHEVFTGWSIAGHSTQHAAVERSTVTLRPFSSDEAIGYVATGEPLDKAGSYAIQGFGRTLVARWTGSFHNVLGLPIEAVRPVLYSFGIAPLSGP